MLAGRAMQGARGGSVVLLSKRVSISFLQFLWSMTRQNLILLLFIGDRTSLPIIWPLPSCTSDGYLQEMDFCVGPICVRLNDSHDPHNSFW